MTEKKNKGLFSAFHTDRFTWHDNILVIAPLSIFLVIVSQFFANIPEAELTNILGPKTPFAETFVFYFGTLAVWIFVTAYFWISKYNRPILTAISPKMKGNTWKMLGLGLLAGFVQNAICVLLAILHGDIYLSFDRFEVFPLLLLFVAVFVQSSSEELICRGFIYQRLKRGYKSPLVWILGNSIIFSAMHLANPGITVLAFMNILLVAVFYSLVVYYFDSSIWFTMAAHAAWNFTQNILFGLPNSGTVHPYSFMKLDASNARDSWIYNVKFGVEGTALACLVILASILITIYFGLKRDRADQDVWISAGTDA